MLIDIVSVFPEYFDMLNVSLLGKAQEKGLLEFSVHNLRDWTHDVHHSVDDTPVGGGAGMVMKPEIWANCLDSLLGIPALDDVSHANYALGSQSNTILVFPNPSATTFTQMDATELSHAQHLIFGCGRYEGYDGRIPQYYAAQGFDVREYSIGDYVLNGGEVAVSVMVEATTRLIDGFMGNHASIEEESYTGSEGLLEHRQYTKPASWRGMDVPEILLSGHHANIDRFRRDEELTRTSQLRPDIIERLECAQLNKKDRKLLMDLGWMVNAEHPYRQE